MKLLLEDVNKLPETVSSQELKIYFEKLILDYQDTALNDKEVAAEVLLELSNKQWHNYEKIDMSLKESLDNYVSNLLDNELSVKLISSLGEVIGYLGLSNSYESLKHLGHSLEVPTILRNEIIDIIEGLGKSVEDPYKKFW